MSVVSDLESILTFYCKSRGKHYERGNGWLELLGPLIALKLPRAATYNLFEAIRDVYIPRYKEFLFRKKIWFHPPPVRR